MPRSQLTKPAALAGLLLLSGSGAGISLAADKEAGSGADTDLGWRSGDLFGSLGQDALDISFGMQQYVVGTGFLFYNESSNGANRGAYWIGERKAAKYAGWAYGMIYASYTFK